MLAYAETWYIWNIQNLSVTGSLLIFIMVIFTETGILCNPENSEPWHNDNPGILRTLKYLKPNKYSDPIKDLIWNIL